MASSRSYSKDEPLYEHNGSELRKCDFDASLRKAGIKKGDIIFVHSDIGSFGRLLTSDRELLLGSLVDSLKEAVGKVGTIIVPTFTYSIEKKEVFDPKSTKSTVGTLTEFFRKQKGILRSLHPTHSVAVWGKLKNEFAKKRNDTFGKNSVFSRLHSFNGKIVFLGAPFQSLTFMHYIERMHLVPYRNLVKLAGKVIVSRKQSDYPIEYYEKYGYFFTSLSMFETYLLKKGIMKKVSIGNGAIMVVDCRRLFEEGWKLLDSDIYFFLRNDGIFRIFNAVTYPFIRYAKPVARLMDVVFSKVILKRKL